MRYSVWIAVLCVGGMVLPTYADDRLQGRWEIVSMTRDGKEDTSMVGAIREHQGNRYSVTPKTGKPIVGKFQVDAAKKTLDMVPTGGRYDGKTLLGIYAIEGDLLKLAFAEPGQQRPQGFEKQAGVVTVLLKRVK